MQLTKYAHACVTLANGEGTIVIDPGTLTPDAAEAVATADAVLVTHEHFDHFDAAVVTSALDANPNLLVFGPPSIAAALGDHDGRVRAVASGDTVTAAGFTVDVHGAKHALIHADIPAVDNVGYLVEGTLYHPGDAYHVPGATVGTLLLPVSGPWTKFGEAADYVRAVRPERMIQIHELMLSDLGRQSAARLLGENGLTGIELTQIPTGEQAEI